MSLCRGKRERGRDGRREGGRVQITKKKTLSSGRTRYYNLHNDLGVARTAINNTLTTDVLVSSTCTFTTHDTCI